MTQRKGKTSISGEAPPLDLQKATKADAAELARVHVASWRETYTGLVPQAMLDDLTVDARAETWRKMLAQPAAYCNTTVFLARVDGLSIGFGACNDQRSEALLKQGFDAEISAIYVLSSSQCRGIGKAVIRAMATYLVSNNNTGVSLWVLKDNMNARRFYKNLGGRVVGEKSDVRANATLQEVAYGWPNLETLT